MPRQACCGIELNYIPIQGSLRSSIQPWKEDGCDFHGVPNLASSYGPPIRSKLPVVCIQPIPYPYSLLLRMKIGRWRFLV